jgi:hypothetical protein
LIEEDEEPVFEFILLISLALALDGNMDEIKNREKAFKNY